MNKLALAIVLLASTAHAQTAMLYTDSKMFAGCCTAPAVGSYVKQWRTDYTWDLKLLPGRDTADTADLATFLAAADYDLVGIDLAVNDPQNLSDFDPANSVARLVTMCGMVRADGGDCILFTPMHAPTTRGLAIDHEVFLEEVANGIRTSGEAYIDLRLAMNGETWAHSCMDSVMLHPNNDACRRILAGYVADEWP